MSCADIGGVSSEGEGGVAVVLPAYGGPSEALRVQPHVEASTEPVRLHHCFICHVNHTVHFCVAR